MLNQKELKEYLRYSRKTGEFTWVKSTGSAVRGSIAGCVNRDGYIQIRVLGVVHKAHRLAFSYVLGDFPRVQVDHRNGVRHDNRWRNLRPATEVENQQNKKAHINAKTGVVGARWRRGRFYATIRQDGKQLYLGSFDTAEGAGAAYLSAKKDVHKFQPVPRGILP